MPVRIVQSRNNPRLKELRKALTHPGRDEKGLVAIEGPNLLEEAILAGIRVPVVYATDQTQQFVEGLSLGPETEVLIFPRPVLMGVLETETPQPVAALVERPDWTWLHLFGTRALGSWKSEHHETRNLVVVLAGLQDPGNLGTILRSAEAFGAHGVISLPGTVNAWNQKALRASAGSVFRLPLISASADECFLKLREAQVKILTTSICGGIPPSSVDMTEPVAFLIGNEGKGVPTEWADQAGGALMIPCPGPVESLNAAVAASILLYEASRQRLERAAEGLATA